MAVMLSAALTVFAGTVTALGMVRRPGSLTARGMIVSVSWVAFRVTIHSPVAPTVRVAEHESPWSMGGKGDTVVAEVTALPLREAVTVAIPRAKPVIGNDSESV